MILDFFFLLRRSHCVSLAGPGPHPVDQAVLKLRASSTSQVLGFKLYVHPAFSFLKCVCAHMCPHPWMLEEGVRSPGSRVLLKGWELPPGFWELNLSPLQEQMLLIAMRSVHEIFMLN